MHELVHAWGCCDGEERELSLAALGPLTGFMRALRGHLTQELRLVWWGQLVTSPLWAQELSFEHLLEIAKTHSDREQASFLPKRVSEFYFPSLLCLPNCTASLLVCLYPSILVPHAMANFGIIRTAHWSSDGPGEVGLESMAAVSAFLCQLGRWEDEYEVRVFHLGKVKDESVRPHWRA